MLVNILQSVKDWANSTFLKLTGGTLTGNLAIRSSNIERSETPSETTYNDAKLRLEGRLGTALSEIDTGRFSNGASISRWIVYVDPSQVAAGNNFSLVRLGREPSDANGFGYMVFDKVRPIINFGTTEASVAFNSNNPSLEFRNVNATQRGRLMFTDYDSVHPGATLAWVTTEAQSWFHTQHIQATDTVDIGQSLTNHSTKVSNAKATVSSNTLVTGYYEKDGSGNAVGYSEVYRTSTGVYRSFAVTNPKANFSTGFYVHALDNGTRNYTSSDGESFRKGLGLANRTWTSLGNCKFNQNASGTTKVTYDLTNYSEVLFVAKCTTANDHTSNSYGGSLLLPKAVLNTTTCEYVLTGGSIGGSDTGGNRYFSVRATTTQAIPIAAYVDYVNRYSTSTLYVYAR